MATTIAPEIEQLQQQIGKLIAQVGRLEDERAIMLVLSKFSHYFDYGRADEFGDLWTEDAVWESRSVKPPHGGSWYEGRAALRGRAAKTPPDKLPPHYHYKHNSSMPMIVLDGAEATVESYCWSLNEQSEKPALNTMCRRVDQLVKEGDRWRFRHVLIEIEAIARVASRPQYDRPPVHAAGCRICASRRSGDRPKR